MLILALLGADFRDLAQRAQEAVVVLEVDRGPVGKVGGSGFAVGDGTIVVTAYHVVEDAESIRVTREGGATVEAEELLAVDPDHDLALVRIDRALPALEVSSDPPPAAGSPVLAVGSPQGLGLAFTDGIVSRVHAWKGIDVLQHSAPLSPGNSGGPLLDEAGRVVGVNSAGLSADAGQNVNFAVAAVHVRALIGGRHDDRKRLHPAGPDLAAPIRASREWEPPTGQPVCASAEEPAWPFPERLPIHELMPAVETDTAVCRHGSDGPVLVYARHAALDARDARLDAGWVALGIERVGGTDCRRDGRVVRDDLAADLVTVRNRDVLHVWMRAERGSGAALCALAGQVADAAKL